MDEKTVDKKWKQFKKQMKIPEGGELGKDESLFDRYLLFNYLLNTFSFEKSMLKIHTVVYTKYNINICNIFRQKQQQDYVSYGPTFISRDGEFKSTFVNISTLKTWLRDDKQSQPFKTVANQFIDENAEFLQTDISKSDLVYVIAACLNQYKYFINYTRPPNNINPDYNKIFAPYMTSINCKPRSLVFRLIDNNSTYVNFKKMSTRQIGVKLLPLSIMDIKNLGHIRRSSFREVYIGQRIQEFVYNFICPNFPILVDWAFFNIDNINMFSNSATFKRYAKSERYLTLIRHLFRAQDVDKEDIKEETIETYLQTVNVAVKHAEKCIILSPKCFMILSEYVGRTLSDLHQSIVELKSGKLDESHNTQYGRINPFETVENFKNLFISYFYALHVLSKRLGMIHGDLHLNNVTYRLKHRRSINVYMVAGKVYYTLSGIVGYIIDFGRTILHADDVRRDFEWDLELIDTQNEKLIKLFTKVMPEYASALKTQIIKALQFSYASIYKVLYAIDPLSLLINFRQHAMKVFAYEVIDLITEIIIFIEDFIREWIPRAIKNEHVDNIPFIGQLIFETFFESGVKHYTDPEDPERVFLYSGYYNSDSPIPDETPEFHQHSDSNLDQNYIKIQNEVLRDYNKYMNKK